MAQEQTLGEKRVRLAFNPSNISSVDQIKMECAGMIDQMKDLTPEDADGEVRRLVALGDTAIEQASMWYVKALTAERS